VRFRATGPTLGQSFESAITEELPEEKTFVV